MGVLIMNKTLHHMENLGKLWSQETRAWWTFADNARCNAIVNRVIELSRPNMAFNRAHWDFQGLLRDRLQCYADELQQTRNSIEARRLWLRGQVNFALGVEVRVASNLVCGGLTMASAIYGLWKYPDDPASVKAWEVAQIAVDSLGLATNGWVIAARVAGRWGLRLVMAECV